MRPSTQLKKDKGMCALLGELSEDEDDIIACAGADIPQDPQRPWLRDYRSYMDAFEQVPEDWSTIQWWGVSLWLQ